jgi:hypothetical protein
MQVPADDRQLLMTAYMQSAQAVTLLESLTSEVGKLSRKIDKHLSDADIRHNEVLKMFSDGNTRMDRIEAAHNELTSKVNNHLDSHTKTNARIFDVVKPIISNSVWAIIVLIATLVMHSRTVDTINKQATPQTKQANP